MQTSIVQTEQTQITGPHHYASDTSPVLVYLASLSESSRRPQRGALNTIAQLVMPDSDAETFPWHMLRYQHTQAIRTMLAEQYSASTANRHLSALRGVLKECWRLGYTDAETYHRAADLKAIKGEKAAQAEKGRHLQAGEFSAMLTACQDGTQAGYRNAALLSVGYACGLRRSELTGLDVADFDADAEALTVRQGKGNKERIVPVSGGALGALLDWLHVRGDAPGPLFVGIRRGDNPTGDRLTPQGVYDILAGLAARAEVKDFTPHDLRRTFAGDLLDAGADIATVQKLMGHANVSTTAGYDRRDAKAKRAAVQRLHVPYQRQFESNAG